MSPASKVYGVCCRDCTYQEFNVHADLRVVLAVRHTTNNCGHNVVFNTYTAPKERRTRKRGEDRRLGDARKS